MNTTNRLGELLVLYLVKKLSPADEKELSAWRNFSPANEKMFQEETDPGHIMAEFEKRQQAKDRVFEKLLQGLPAPVKKPKRKPIFILLSVVGRAVASIAAFVIAVNIWVRMIFSFPLKDSNNLYVAGGDIIPSHRITYHIAFGFLETFNKLSAVEVRDKHWVGTAPDDAGYSNIPYLKMFTPEDLRFTLKFSDGTTIWFNGLTTVKYPSKMKRDSIHLFISGEAYIQIPPATKHVYLIKLSPPPVNGDRSTADAFQIISRGGTFNMRAYPEESTTTITPVNVTMHVDDAGRTSVQQIAIRPGQQLQLESGKLNIVPVPDFKKTGEWRND